MLGILSGKPVSACRLPRRKYRIFKNPQKSKHENTFQDHIHLPYLLALPLLYPDTAEPADKGFSYQQDQKSRPAPGIKDKRKNKENPDFLYFLSTKKYTTQVSILKIQKQTVNLKIPYLFLFSPVTYSDLPAIPTESDIKNSISQRVPFLQDIVIFGRYFCKICILSKISRQNSQAKDIFI